jgi:hypothetical protein
MSDHPTPPTLSDLFRSAAHRDRLRVDGSASTTDVSAALHQVRNDRDRDDNPVHQGTRLVRDPEPTVSDVLRRLRDEEDPDVA